MPLCSVEEAVADIRKVKWSFWWTMRIAKMKAI